MFGKSLPANLQDHFHANLGRETRSEVLLILCKLSFSNTIVSILISDLNFLHPGNNWELPFNSIGAEGVVEIKLLSHITWNKIISNLVWLQQFTCFLHNLDNPKFSPWDQLYHVAPFQEISIEMVWVYWWIFGGRCYRFLGDAILNNCRTYQKPETPRPKSGDPFKHERTYLDNPWHFADLHISPLFFNNYSNCLVAKPSDASISCST